MAESRTTVNIAVDQVISLADRVGQLDARQLAAAAASTLNEVVDRTYELARERISAGINLSDDYLRRRMSVTEASPANLTAEITAAGGRSALTRLATYDAQIAIAPRKTAGPSRNRGRLGIPQGMKQVGVNVQVRRGEVKPVQGGFLLPLRQGTQDGNKFGVFRRRNGKLEHRYGPSAYQLFRWQAPRLVDEVGEDLESTLGERIDEQIKETLG